MQYKIRKKLIILVFILPAISFFCSAVHSRDGKSLKIFSTKKNNNPIVKEFLAQLENSADSIFSPGEAKRDFNIYVILFSETAKTKKLLEISESGNILKISLPEDISRWDRSYYVHKSILAALILKKFSIKLKGNDSKVSEWFLAGLLHRFQRHVIGQRGMALNLYPFVNALTVTGQLPDLRGLLKYPLGYSDGVLWEFYSECCELMIESVLKIPKGREALRSMIVMGTQDISSETAFVSAMSEILKNRDISAYTLSDSDILENPGNDDLVNLWFKYAMTTGSVNLLSPGTSDFIKRRFEIIQTVNYKVKNKEDPAVFSEETCKIIDLPLDIEEEKQLAQRQEKYFAGLLFQAPMFFYPALREILNSFAYLKKNDEKSFSKEYLKAVKEFYTATEKMKEIENYLEQEENKSVALSKKYALSYKVTEGYINRRENAWPALKEFLAEEEKY